MMALIGTLLVGLIVGLIARAIKPGDDNMGWLMTIGLGILGSWKRKEKEGLCYY